jgi:hypothetical protein
MSEKIGLVTVLPADARGPLLPGAAEVSPDTQREVDQEVRRVVHEAHAEVSALLSENRQRLEALAAAPLEHESLEEPQAYAAAGLPAPAHGAARDQWPGSGGGPPANGARWSPPRGGIKPAAAALLTGHPTNSAAAPTASVLTVRAATVIASLACGKWGHDDRESTRTREVNVTPLRRCWWSVSRPKRVWARLATARRDPDWPGT